MKFVPLADVCVPVDTWNPAHFPDSRFNYIDLSAIDNETKSVVGSTWMAGAEAPSRARQLVRTGDVLVSTVRPNLNAVAVVPPQLDGAVASTGFAVLRPSAKLDGRFLFHWVRSPGFVVEMTRRATGASYPAVSDRIVKGSAIPEVPPDQQQRIAAILDAADRIRAKRREVLAHLDALPQAIFAEMFGEGSWNSKVDALAEVQIGPFGSLLHQEDYVSGGVPVINPTHIRVGRLHPDDAFSVAEAKAQTLTRYRLLPGDVVLGRRGEMGRAGVAGPEHEGMLCGTGSLILRPRDVASEFLHAVMTSGRTREHLKSNALGATLPNLNAAIVRGVPAPQPSPSMQANFTERITAIDAQRAVVARALAADDELFAALQSRAFRGEL